MMNPIEMVYTHLTFNRTSPGPLVRVGDPQGRVTILCTFDEFFNRCVKETIKMYY